MITPSLPLDPVSPGCMHGNQIGCPSCAATVAELCAGFAEDVRAGRCDADGFTASDRRKRQPRPDGLGGPSLFGGGTQ